MPLNEPNLSRISFAIFSADLPFVPVDMSIAMSAYLLMILRQVLSISRRGESTLAWIVA